MHAVAKSSLLILAFSFGLVAEANAWSRNGTVYGPRGTASVSAQGSCAGGTCQRSISRTGVYGNTVSRSGSVSCNGAGTCSGNRVTTGPYGGTVTRHGTVSR